MNTADVVIVGGGIAGASLAYRLAGHCKLVLLEAEPQPGYHASGRSAALFTASYGVGPVRALADASREFLLRPPPVFGEAPLARPRGVLWIAREDQAAPLAALRKQLGGHADLQACQADEAERSCPALRPGYVAAAALEAGAFDIDVHALLQGYLRAFRAGGGELRTGAAVTAIRRRGSAWQVDTATERYQCALLVNAAGAWADRIAALAGVAPIGLVPKRRTAITFDPLGVASDGTPLGRWPCVIDVEEQFYFKPDAGRVLASPADETPVSPGDAQADELDVATAVDRVERATCLRVERIAARWAGLRSFVADGVPVAGMNPEVTGFFWLAAQGGYGIMTSPALGALAAALITGNGQSSGPLEAELSPLRLPRTAAAAQAPA